MVRGGGIEIGGMVKEMEEMGVNGRRGIGGVIWGRRRGGRR